MSSVCKVFCLLKNRVSVRSAGVFAMLAAALMLLSAPPSRAARTPVYPVYRMSRSPGADGASWDAAMSDFPEATGFFILGGEDYAVEKQTFFRAGWMDESLFLYIRCIEPLMGKLQASDVDGSALWADDAIEMFFQPDGGPGYYQMVANSAGTRWNAVGPDPRSEEIWGWEVSPGKWEEGWSLKIRIPFSALDASPAAGDRWPVNIARVLTTGPGDERLTCWPPLESRFAEPERFGEFAFSGESPVARRTEMDEAGLNEPFYAYLRERCSAAVREAGRPEMAAALSRPELAAEARPAKDVLEELEFLASEPGASPRDMRIMLTTWRNVKEALSEKAGELGIPLERMPSKELDFQVISRRAGDVELWVNGEPAAGERGRRKVVLREGVNVIGMKAYPGGRSPGLRLRVRGHPELETRWRMSVGEEPGWLSGGFDDRSWAAAEADSQGFLSLPEDSREVYFRQIVLWGEKYYSGLPCIQPKVREWGFPAEGMETFFHVLYTPPPLTFQLEDYEFVLDIPEGFKLLDEVYPEGIPHPRGGRLNRRPENVAEERIDRDGRSYTRYRFGFSPDFFRVDRGDVSLIPILHDGYAGPAETEFYFRRLASGNLTELEQVLPVRVLPPIDGLMPEKFMISQYIATPWLIFTGEGGGRLFPRHFDAHMEQSLDAGFNVWFIGAWEGELGRRVYDRVIERDGTVALMYNNFPIHGNRGIGRALGRLMEEVPETRARFFNDTDAWDRRGQYCPSYVTGEGAGQFKDAVKSDISAMLHGTEERYAGFPGAKIYWTDWERVPWVEAGMGYRAPRTGDGSHCFCDNCKEAFREHEGLPEDADLSDDAIWNNYRLDWSLFRYELDGRINGIVKEAVNELGMKYSFYTGVHDRDSWRSVKNRIDIAFPGSPGDGMANSGRQEYLDGVMKFFREEGGMRRIKGQLFASNFPHRSTEPWRNWRQASAVDDEGYINAKSLKPQIIRMAASFHGGVDLNSSMERCAGQRYYIAEAARLISEYEHLFWDGERADLLAESENIGYPDLLVLEKAGERLVLLFNESEKPLKVSLRNLGLAPGSRASVHGSDAVFEDPEVMDILVEPDDVEAVHIW